MKILVTGGAGYVGSVLTQELLGAGHSVRVIDSLMHGGAGMLGHWSHSAFSFHRGDVRNGQDVKAVMEGIDAVVHLAAIVGDPACARDPELSRSTNLDGTKCLLAAARQAGVSRFVFASTCSNYGRMSDPLVPLNEDSELNPVSLYAETKVISEQLVTDPDAPASFSGIALRFSTVYGVSPRMRFDLTVNEFAMEAVTKGKLVVFGQQFWRPYIHVRDAARAIAAALTAPAEKVRGRVFNVGSDAENYRKKDIVDLILVQSPQTEIEYVHKTEDPRDYRVSFSRIREQLGFQPAYSVANGITEVAELVQSGVIVEPNARQYKN